MKTIKHSLHFITELDENHPTAKQLLDLSKTIKELNENNSFATLRLA
jgi:hypothetical protein